MVKFDSSAIISTVDRRAKAGKINRAAFPAELILALAAAALAPYTDKLLAVFLPFLAVSVAGALALLLFNLLYVVKLNKSLKREVAKEIAAAFEKNASVLAGAETVEFTVEYAGDILTLTRKGGLGEVKISSSTFAAGEKLTHSANRLQFDLKELKRAPSVYSSAGELLWQFLQAYYGLNQAGIDRVTVTDLTGGKPLELTAVQGGKPIKPIDNNYFIKTGILK